MTEPRGLYHKFGVRRRDNGATVTSCVVLSLGDPEAQPALMVWADTVEAGGNVGLARDIRAAIAEINDELEGGGR